MNALAAESDAEVPQTLHACSAPFPASLITVSMENQYPPSVVLGVVVWWGGGATTQRNRNSTESWRVYCASLTELPTYLIILIKLINWEPGRSRAHSAANNNKASPLISRQFPITCINYSEFPRRLLLARAQAEKFELGEVEHSCSVRDSCQTEHRDKHMLLLVTF